MTGKEKCKILNRLRKDIAKANGINYVSEECTFEGKCPGFCPKCDSEALYISQQIQSLNKKGIEIKLDVLDTSTFIENENLSISDIYYDVPLADQIDFEMENHLLGDFISNLDTTLDELDYEFEDDETDETESEENNAQDACIRGPKKQRRGLSGRVSPSRFAKRFANRKRHKHVLPGYLVIDNHQEEKPEKDSKANKTDGEDNNSNQ